MIEATQAITENWYTHKTAYIRLSGITILLYKNHSPTVSDNRIITSAIIIEIGFLSEDIEMNDYVRNWENELKTVNECKDENVLINYIDNYYIENNLSDVMEEYVIKEVLWYE